MALVRVARWRAPAACSRWPSDARAWASSRASWTAAVGAGGARSCPGGAGGGGWWKGGRGEGVVEAAVGQGPGGQQLDGEGGQLGVVGLAGQAQGDLPVGLGRLPVAGVEVQAAQQQGQPSRGDQEAPVPCQGQPPV